MCWLVPDEFCAASIGWPWPQKDVDCAGERAEAGVAGGRLGHRYSRQSVKSYEWDISDSLAWGTNARHVDRRRRCVATNSAFARLMCSGNAVAPRRSAPLEQATPAPGGLSGPVLHPRRRRTTPMWVEDTGRSFAGPDGRPCPWHGARHQRAPRPEERLLSALTVSPGMNRRQLADVLADTLQDAIRLRTSFAMLVVSIDDLARINENTDLRSATK
jgi:hypothetical protein